MTILTEEMKTIMRIPYALRRVPPESFACLLPVTPSPLPGDIALAQLLRIGKNARLELTNGRPCNLHEGDLLGVVFGNRYATQQFEGYARANGEFCDLLSMAGVCGLVEGKHASVAEPTNLRLLGFLGDADGRALRLRDFALAPTSTPRQPNILVVCGTSMDAGKTHTAMSLIVGLRRHRQRVAAIKLTGTATGRDTWSMLDAGAYPALDFVDGGIASTYLCTLDDLLILYRLLTTYAAAKGADWVVVEIADGLLQEETAALLRSPAFTATVDAWVFATGDPVAAAGGVCMLRGLGIEPIAISGVISMSPLAMRETQAVTGIHCLTARELQCGDLNALLEQTLRRMPHPPSRLTQNRMAEQDA